MKMSNDASDSSVYIRVVLLGTVAGLRSLTAPALLSYAAARENKTGDGNFFASDGAAVGFGLLAVGELIGDKLPNTPNRTEPAGLAARAISGAICGGIVSSKHRKSVPIGIALGALAAVGAAYAGQTVRRAIVEETGVHSSLVGAVEDAIAVSIGVAALKD